jgi:hypothetical protein
MHFFFDGHDDSIERSQGFTSRMTLAALLSRISGCLLVNDAEGICSRLIAPQCKSPFHGALGQVLGRQAQSLKLLLYGADAPASANLTWRSKVFGGEGAWRPSSER